MENNTEKTFYDYVNELEKEIYGVFSQGFLLFTTMDEKIAKEYVESENEKWSKYVLRCIENMEIYADNGCIYEKLN